MIEIKMPVSDDLLLDKDEVRNILQRMYDKGYHDGVEAYKAMMELEKEEPAEWTVDTDDSRRWDRVRFYCSSCNGWNTYGKSKYCPNCGRRMQREGLQRENS